MVSEALVALITRTVTFGKAEAVDVTAVIAACAGLGVVGKAIEHGAEKQLAVFAIAELRWRGEKRFKKKINSN